MIQIPRSHPDSMWPSWAPLRDGDRKSATVVCPAGHLGVLTDHTIADDGTVTPSVVCPEQGCGWHEHIRLGGWPGDKS